MALVDSSCAYRHVPAFRNDATLSSYRARPALSGNVRGLLIVCGVEIILFSLIFGLGWLASRASREGLLFRWRPGWWVVPLGIAYSVAIRFALLVVVMVVAAILLTTKTSTPETLQGFVSANRPNVETLVSVSAMGNNPSYFWLTVTLVSFVVAGLREEIWRAGTLAAVRALWPGAFASRGRQCLAVALIAVLFGAMHGTNCRRPCWSSRMAARHDHDHAQVDLARGDCARFVRRDHHGDAAVGHGKASAPALTCNGAVMAFCAPNRAEAESIGSFPGPQSQADGDWPDENRPGYRTSVFRPPAKR
jgi:membrane protease YdiL (CAAX protease family)